MEPREGSPGDGGHQAGARRLATGRPAVSGPGAVRPGAPSHTYMHTFVCGGGFIWVLLEFLYSLSVGPEGWTKCRGKWCVLATAAQAVLAAIREQCLGTGPSWARGALPWFHAGPPTGHEEASGTPVTAEQVLPLQLQNVNLSWPASSVYERCGPGSARLVCGFMQEITFSIFRLPPL